MDVSPNALRKEATQVYTQAKEMLERLERSPVRMPDTKATLLQTQAQCLNTLTLLREQGKKR